MMPTSHSSAIGKFRAGRWLTPRTAAGILAVLATSVLLGYVVASLNVFVALIAAVTLLPVLSHIRWVGVRRAITEPSPVTLILVFYVFAFPQRGAVVAVSDALR